MDDTKRPPRTTLIQSRLLAVILMFGQAITLPMPRRRQLVLARRELREDELRHEFVHCWQLVDWGAFTYLGRHIWARLKARSLTAPISDVEFPCYQAQFPDMGDADLEDYLTNG